MIQEHISETTAIKNLDISENGMGFTVTDGLPDEVN